MKKLLLPETLSQKMQTKGRHGTPCLVHENVLWGEIPDLVCHPDGSRGDADGVIAGTNEWL